VDNLVDQLNRPDSSMAAAHAIQRNGGPASLGPHILVAFRNAKSEDRRAALALAAARLTPLDPELLRELGERVHPCIAANLHWAMSGMTLDRAARLLAGLGLSPPFVPKHVRARLEGRPVYFQVCEMILSTRRFTVVAETPHEPAPHGPFVGALAWMLRRQLVVTRFETSSTFVTIETDRHSVTRRVEPMGRYMDVDGVVAATNELLEVSGTGQHLFGVRALGQEIPLILAPHERFEAVAQQLYLPLSDDLNEASRRAAQWLAGQGSKVP